jgi:hypothetical protein
VRFAEPDLGDRKTWTLPPATGSYADLDLALLNRDDEDERHVLIEAEHPWFGDALRDDDIELEVRGEPMNPRLHISVHEIVTNQLWANDPPEVWATAQRLAALGYDRHVVLHMIASVVSHDLWEAVHHREPHDRADYIARLDALPQRWPAPGRVVAH